MVYGPGLFCQRVKLKFGVSVSVVLRRQSYEPKNFKPALIQSIRIRAIIMGVSALPHLNASYV
jgi:hypothetical protein